MYSDKCLFSGRSLRALLYAIALPVTLGVCSVSRASMIDLGASASQSVQILALPAKTFEIQLGGGNNQPPSDTFITGTAILDIGGNIFSGFYRLSTDPLHQLQMVNTVAGGTIDQYSFLAGHNILNFVFAPTLGFNTPYLVGDFILGWATQQVPGNSGNLHPSILLFGTMGSPTSGSLANQVPPGGLSQFVLDVGGNQRLLDLTPGNSFSGMSLQNGAIAIVPEPSTVLVSLAVCGLALAAERRASRKSNVR